MVSNWQPIDTAPMGKNPDNVIWLMLAWGTEEDKSLGAGMRWRDKWFVAASFYRAGSERKYEIREVEVVPTHWMRLPEVPAQQEVDNGI